jgi:hypothetical protein
VVLVLFPEHSAFRSRAPREAVDLLTTRLREIAPEVQVLNLIDTMQDDEFWDLYHLNRAGGERFTKLLGERLKQLSEQAPQAPAKE